MEIEFKRRKSWMLAAASSGRLVNVFKSREDRISEQADRFIKERLSPTPQRKQQLNDGKVAHPLSQMSTDLKSFWGQFQSGRINANPGKAGGRLQALRFMAMKQYKHKKIQSIYARRKKFNLNYEFLKYFRNPCFSCGGKTLHRHHIVPLMNGGMNTHENIIGLCEWCHKEVHPHMKGLKSQELKPKGFMGHEINPSLPQPKHGSAGGSQKDC